MDKKDWQKLVEVTSKDRPSVGRRVMVVGGKKHKAKIGVVKRHQVDRYTTAFRYGSEAQKALRELRGQYGYVCLIETETETFWVRADYLSVQ